MIVFGLDIENKDAVIKWLNELRRGTGDARPLWTAMIPKITEFVNYEFHPTMDAHKGWASLKQKYKESKMRHGYPPGIGIRTGKLRLGAGEKAIKQMDTKSLLWKLDVSIPVENGIPYAHYFHFGTSKMPARTIYKYIALRVNSFLSLDVKRFNDGQTHANFTYTWLSNTLRKMKL